MHGEEVLRACWASDFYTVVHSTGVEVAAGAGQGTDEGKRMWLMSMHGHQGHGLL